MLTHRTSKKPLIVSIVVPVHNEANSISLLEKRIKVVCERADISFETIFVDDGSSDKTSEILFGLRGVTVVRLRKKFGQTAALDAGIKVAKGRYIVTMDGDGQNDPADIPKLLKKLEAGNYDCVCGWRRNRKDSFGKRFISKGAHLLRNLLIHDGVHDSGCTLKIFKRECFDNIDLYGEMHRFIPALLKIRGFKIGEIVVRHHPRRHGKSKYDWKRTIKGGLDILALWFWGKFINRPLHILGTLGLASIFVSLVSLIMLAYLWFVQRIDLTSSALTYIFIFSFVSGIQFFISGLIMDVLVKTYHASKGITNYEIAEIIEAGHVSGVSVRRTKSQGRGIGAKR